MDILLFNVEWMTFNIILAFLGVILGIVFLYIKNKFLKTIIFLVWILYLPNTIYLITDTQHFWGQWLKLNPPLHWYLLIQYIVLVCIGVITFLLSFYLLDKFLTQSKIKKDKSLIIFILIFMNYLISFGVALGRIERLNSYEAIINPLKVISASLKLLSSPEAIIAIIIFGTFTNFLYFFFRKKIKIKM